MINTLEVQEFGALDVLLEIFENDEELQLYRINLVNQDPETGIWYPRHQEEERSLLTRVVSKLKEMGFNSTGHPRNPMEYAVFKNTALLKMSFDKFVKEIKNPDVDCIVKIVMDFYSTGDRKPTLDKYFLNTASIDYPC